MDGVVDAFLRHLRNSNEELVAEVAWVVAHLTTVSSVAAGILIRGDLIQLLVEILATSNNLKLLFAGEGVEQKKLAALCELRRSLSPSEHPPVKPTLNAGAVTLLVKCLSFGSPYEQLFEVARCLNIIAEKKPK